MSSKRLVTVVLGVLALVGTAQSRGLQDGASYQLYSWKEKGHWHYNLLAGERDRTRTYEEITSGPGILVGTSRLESQLKRLPKGTVVFWQSDAPSGISRPPTGKAKSFKHPSRKRIQGIQAHCEKYGIKLSLI
jgi:hypothetical protein